MERSTLENEGTISRLNRRVSASLKRQRDQKSVVRTMKLRGFGICHEVEAANSHRDKLRKLEGGSCWAIFR